MDQLRGFFRTLKRIHFWLICGSVMLLCLIGWFLAVSSLSKTKDERVRNYEGLFSELDSLIGKPRIANQTVSDEMENLISRRREEIAEAWEVKYEQQNSKETGILTWPEEEDFGPRLIRKIGHLRPIEKELPYPLPDSDDRDLNIGLKEDYREYIYKELPRMAQSIGATWNVNPDAFPGRPQFGEGGYPSRGMFGQTGETLATQDVVDWNEANQQELIADHFTWRDDAAGGRGEGGFMQGQEVVTARDDEPNTLEVLYAQEDLWVLRALMKIIERTNDGAQSRFNAAVKEIDFIRIGKAAIPSAGRVTTVLSADEESAQQQTGLGPMDGYPGEGGFQEAPMSRGEPFVEPGQMTDDNSYSERGEFGMGPTLQDPAEGRYVDKDYQPLPAQKLREVMTSTESIAPEDAYLAVAKRVPIRMRLSIDQRRLARLLVACANSELTVEVRQVRLNPQDDGSAVNSPYGEMLRPQRRSEFRPRAGEGFFNTGMGNEEIVNQFPYDVSAEIYGIVFIYNPVDKRALGIDEEAETTELAPESVTMNIGTRVDRS